MHKLLICSSYKYEYTPISYSSQHFSANYLSALSIIIKRTETQLSRLCVFLYYNPIGRR